MNTENEKNRSFFEPHGSLTTLDEQGTFRCNGGDGEPDHDGGHGSDGDGNWDGK